MEDYKQYLAQKILTEDQVVTYRLLSRALKVHVNAAKEMLYDFHKRQNDKRPDSLHATYIIYGTKSRPVSQDEDVEMTDSQASEAADAPYSDLVPTFTLSLVRQEQLQETLSQYTEVTSLHIYSLAPHPLKDLQLLTDVTRQVQETSIADGIPNPSKVYGTIANKNVRKRKRQGKPIPAASKPKPEVEQKAPVKQEAKPTPAAAAKEEPKEVAKSATASTTAKKPTPAASLKRQGSSGIGQMFAKAAAKPKKPAPPKVAAEDNQATGALSDDGEDDAEPMSGVKSEDNKESSSARQARKDRQAELQRMMEESDEEEEEEAEAEAEKEDPMDEEPPPPEPETETKTEEQEPAEVVSSTTGGRRRGRRRVMRKKQILDEKGYLVTMQEAGWESFSEDEAPPPPPKAKPQEQKSVKAEPSTTTKSKKGGAAGKGGQGNIMSFFSKK
ncbi:DNA polymerase subunit Cdc27 [Xylaria bambusicola]|uniref:DNA polymerase subunit Cdc27 n=1 Tax=Xylaria bambusicola TaxID=326684 RepID=UPI0020084032|nr:DNA polymerase subunit Cdc27 [Xylaria bambusicola]KAI0508688.1 DNA polymerase subunit Cdc27 [Xylaria bambusicola]